MIAVLFQWRDHWMQAIYYPKTQISLEKGDEFSLQCFHDEYSLWFDVARGDRLAAAFIMICFRVTVGLSQ